MGNANKQASLAESIAIILVLFTSVLFTVIQFRDNAIGGPIQLALFFTAFIGIALGFKNGMTWDEIDNEIKQTAAIATTPIFILLAIGALIGTWILCGTVPSLIYYGLKILSPAIFYPTACLICAFVSLSIGSSWTTIATIGIALLGVSNLIGLNTAITVGAIVSGSYFGDKMSPLSDTTNLAPAVAGSELFSHIRHMMWVSIPSLVIAIALYAALGLSAETEVTTVDMADFNLSITQNFTIGPHLLLPLALLLFMAYRRAPAFPTIFLGALVGGIFAVLFQPDLAAQRGYLEGSGPVMQTLRGILLTMFSGFEANTGNQEIDQLLSKGGMNSMLETIWLILSAMFLSGVLMSIGVLKRIMQSLFRLTKSTGNLIAATLGNCILVNLLTGEQYVSVILPGQIWRQEYKRRKLAAINLSRCLEDAGTLTSPLIPWTSCGAYIYGVLGLASFAYIPFCFFNILNPILSAIYGYLGITITKELDD